MRQVNHKYYNKEYYEIQSSSPNFSKKINPNKFHKKYHEMASLINIGTNDHICDYGCGDGDLSFLLWLKYKCKITSIDYSPDAINICQHKLKKFIKNTDKKAKIKFYNLDNQNIPKLKNIRAVYFCDVFEHLYPEEIKHIINHVIQWNRPDIIIHTDNNLYLKLIRPISEIISLIIGRKTLKQIKKEKEFHQTRHVNLTNPKALSKTMSRFGYYQTKLKYPQADKQTIIKQLGLLPHSSFFIWLSLFTVQLFPFLTPSFYSVYSSKTHKNF